MYDIKITPLSDLEIVKQIGQHIKDLRLTKNLTQKYVANASGLDRSTISEIENGRPTNILTLVQILRSIDALDDFSPFFVEKPISPRLISKFESKQRKRAKGNKIEDSNSEKLEW